jgi:hypothetical protein
MKETVTQTILVAQPGWYVATFCPAEKGGKWEWGTPITMQGSPTDTGFDDTWAVKGPDGRFDFVDTIFDTKTEAINYASGLH